MTRKRKSLIPHHLRDEFLGWMAAHDFDDMPDGAWFATLETAAEQFIEQHGLRADANDAAHWYLRVGTGAKA
ncbi:hypothetical protein [Burkholderia gladioli]